MSAQGLQSSASFRTDGALGVRPAASSSTLEINLMVSAWVDSSQRADFENQLMNLSGKGLKSVALQQNLEKDICEVAGLTRGMCTVDSIPPVKVSPDKDISTSISTSSLENSMEKYMDRASSESKRKFVAGHGQKETESTPKNKRLNLLSRHNVFLFFSSF